MKALSPKNLWVLGPILQKSIPCHLPPLMYYQVCPLQPIHYFPSQLYSCKLTPQKMKKIEQLH
jgi:hypothetical protein